MLIPAADAPEFDEEAGRVFAEGWPEFIFHDALAKQYAERRDQYFAEWNFYFVAEGSSPAPGSGGAPAPGSGGAPAPGSGGAPAPGSGGAPAPGSGGAPAPSSGGPAASAPASASAASAPAERRLIAGCWGVPLRWDGSIADLPGGYSDAVARSVTAYESGIVPNTFVLMAAGVRPDQQGQGAAAALVTAVRDRAVAHGLTQVIAPLRPTLKSRYPLTDIATYVSWTRDDGLPLDPWLRTHVRLGATILAPAPDSQTITGSVSDWEKWTGMPFPSPGTYTIPAGLSTLTIANGIGTYTEPNIWVRHA